LDIILGPEDIAAFDMLDRELSDERNVLTFRMEPGEMLFIDNTTSAHDRRDGTGHCRIFFTSEE
jgi:alpha-ketoglutarate-dependent taurine dioxygenase